MRRFAIAVVVVLLCCSHSFADDDEQHPEIEYLLAAIGKSECVFIRNGSSHTAEKAEEHLRMKYRRGRKYADTAEAFIENLASKSSWTGRPYMMECSDTGEEPTGEWLLRRLEEFRSVES